MLAALHDLAPDFAARSKEIEDGRRVPSDIADKLRQLGLFRTLLPRSLGGLDLSAPDVVQMIETLAAADSSVGWVAMIGVTSQIFATRAPRPLLERIYLEEPDALVVGAGTPAGQAEKIKGSYRISGRWPFASGCQNAQWIGDSLRDLQERPARDVGAGPANRYSSCFRQIVCAIEETWQASGLTGTGSHHVALNDVEVREEDVFDLFHGRVVRAGAARKRGPAVQ